MDEKELNGKLRELILITANLPPDSKKQQGQSTDTNPITKSLTDLQICIKYIMFDLEATRRERDQLKEILDDDEPNLASGEM